MAISISRNRRKNYFIKKKFQTRFILRFCFPVIFTALIAAIVVYYFSSQSTVTVFENSRLVIKPGTEFIIPGLILSALFSIILVGIATVIIMFFISHRIAGPLYKVENSLERMADGDLSFDIHFRKRDEIKKLANAFNMTSRKLNGLIGDVKQERAELDSAVSRLNLLTGKLSPEQREALKENIKKLEAVNNRFEKKLLKFKLRRNGKK